MCEEVVKFGLHVKPPVHFNHPAVLITYNCLVANTGAISSVDEGVRFGRRIEMTEVNQLLFVLEHSCDVIAIVFTIEIKIA